MIGSICNYFIREITTAFCGPIISWKEIGKEFWWDWWDHIPKDF